MPIPPRVLAVAFAALLLGCGSSPEKCVPVAAAQASDALAFSSPVANECWAVGSSHVISWNAGPALTSSPSVVVEFSSDGATWQPLHPSASGVVTPPGSSGTAVWTVPGPSGSRSRLRLRDLTGSTASVISEPLEILPDGSGAYRWQLVTDSAPFAPRDGAGTAVLGGRMWLLGGWNANEPDLQTYPDRTNNEIWSSSDGLDWQFAGRAPWSNRHSAGVVLHRDRIFILGGDAVSGRYEPDVWSSADGLDWRLETAAAPWGRRVLHNTFEFAGRIWVMGGQTMPQFAPEVAQSIFYDDVWSSDDGVHWTQDVERAPWAARGAVIGNAVLGGRMWLIGGGTYETPDSPGRFADYNDVWSTRDGVHWQQFVKQAPWGVRQYVDTVAFDGKLWVLGGTIDYPSSDMNDVWYSADGVNWYELPGSPWVKRHAGNVFVHDGALWLVAGSSMTRDVWKLTASR